MTSTASRSSPAITGSVRPAMASERELDTEREGEPAVGESPVQLDEVRAAPERRMPQPAEERALLPIRVAAARRESMRDEHRARVGVAVERHHEVEVDRLPQRDVAVQLQRERRPLERERRNPGALEQGPQL